MDHSDAVALEKREGGKQKERERSNSCVIRFVRETFHLHAFSAVLGPVEQYVELADHQPGGSLCLYFLFCSIKDTIWSKARVKF